MKNLVKKIALPGAILAFAMALFGGATYAYSTLTTWDETGRGHLNDTYANIDKLESRIQGLMTKKAELQDKWVANEEQVKKFDAQIKKLTAEKEQLEKDLKLSRQATDGAKAWGEKNNAEKNKTINELNKEISNLKKEKNQLSTNVNQMNTEKVKLSTQISELNAQVTDLKAQLSKEKQRSEELERSEELVKAIEHSRSVRDRSQQAVDNTKEADKILLNQ